MKRYENENKEDHCNKKQKFNLFPFFCLVSFFKTQKFETYRENALVKIYADYFYL